MHLTDPCIHFRRMDFGCLVLGLAVGHIVGECDETNSPADLAKNTNVMKSRSQAGREQYIRVTTIFSS